MNEVFMHFYMKIEQSLREANKKLRASLFAKKFLEELEKIILKYDTSEISKLINEVDEKIIIDIFEKLKFGEIEKQKYQTAKYLVDASLEIGSHSFPQYDVAINDVYNIYNRIIKYYLFLKSENLDLLIRRSNERIIDLEKVLNSIDETGIVKEVNDIDVFERVFEYCVLSRDEINFILQEIAKSNLVIYNVKKHLGVKEEAPLKEELNLVEEVILSVKEAVSHSNEPELADNKKIKNSKIINVKEPINLLDDEEQKNYKEILEFFSKENEGVDFEQIEKKYSGVINCLNLDTENRELYFKDKTYQDVIEAILLTDLNEIVEEMAHALNYWFAATKQEIIDEELINYYKGEFQNLFDLAYKDYFLLKSKKVKEEAKDKSPKKKLLYLKTVNNRNIVLEDAKDIPQEYYLFYKESLEELAAGDFDHNKAKNRYLTSNEKLKGVLEKKFFKIRTFFTYAPKDFIIVLMLGQKTDSGLIERLEKRYTNANYVDQMHEYEQIIKNGGIELEKLIASNEIVHREIINYLEENSTNKKNIEVDDFQGGVLR